jgi:HK97 family phage major capsid protein
MSFHSVLETKNASELPEADVLEIKTALTALTTDINTKLAPVADLTTRLAAVESKLARPAIHTKAGTDEAKAMESKALDHYLRNFGTDGFRPDEVKAMTAGVNADGGYTIPETFVVEIIKNITEFSPMRDLARVTSVSGSPVILPRRLTTPAQPPVVAEGAAASGTQSTYGQWEIPTYEMREFVDISNQLIEDSAFNLSSEINSDLAEVFGEKEGDLFFNGTGVNQTLGLTKDTDFVTQAASAIAIKADDLIDLFYSVKSSYSRRGAWGMNRSVIAQVRKFKSTTGEYLWVDSLANGQPATFLGKPVVEVPGLGGVTANSVPVVFGDWDRGYRIFDRIALTMLPDRLTQAANGLVRFHARRRVGGKLVTPEALVGLKMPAA